MQEKPSHEDRLMAALAYPFWYFVFMLVYLSPQKKKSRFLRYHTYQGLFLGLLTWVGGTLIWTAVALLGKFLILLSLLLYPVLRLMRYAVFAVTAYATVGAWLGSYVEIPYITEFARPFVDEGE